MISRQQMHVIVTSAIKFLADKYEVSTATIELAIELKNETVCKGFALLVVAGIETAETLNALAKNNETIH